MIYSGHPCMLDIVFDCKDYSLKRVTLIEEDHRPAASIILYSKKTGITFVKKPLPQ
ncbi:hypothetical protein R4J00_11120 [Brachyspira intermedia]|uniref:hypothetical protein n=1 Tax=Brachyspira intermedia TaxID=84377 RepID=UPI0026379D43|nr:hypothetical protein [uncultured Brachyspira sp.]